MLDSNQKPTGTNYTGTVALLMVAFIFIPAVLILSRPVGYDSISVAVVCSTLSVVLAWVNWKKRSELAIPSIETLKVRSR